MACRRFLKLKVRLSHQTAGGAEGLSVEASDAAATSRRLARRVIEPYFFSQTAKASAKARYPGRPFSMARMARAAIVVGDWDVEPGAFLEDLNIALLIRIGGRKLDYENTIRRPGIDISERST